MCTEDEASVNIRDRLVELADFEIIGSFDNRPVRMFKDFLLFEKEGLHLYLDGVDREIRNSFDHDISEVMDMDPEGETPLDLLVFLSKHSSEREIKSLTVHPPGNYTSADHGGRPGYLPPSSPREMTSALKSLYKEKKKLGLKDQTTFEVTHHGPVVSSPCFFIEIGSDPKRWGIPLLGEAIARGLLSESFLENNKELPVAIGLGGGHYAPRFTDRAMRNKFAFGHMIPDYIISDQDDLLGPMRLARDSTKGAEYVFVHRSKRNTEMLEGVEEAAQELGLKIAGI
jgi:D-aminoacyl-tRNA deacylase